MLSAFQKRFARPVFLRVLPVFYHAVQRRLVPSYIMWTQTFHIRNTLFALLIPNLLMSAFNVIMMRTYFTQYSRCRNRGGEN